MYRKSPRYFKYVFFGIVLSDIVLGHLGLTEFRVISKPLILISLLVYFLRLGTHLEKRTYVLSGCALILSLFGDVFLLFEAYSSLYFVLGLTSFLLAHLLYGFIFSKKRNKRPPIILYIIALLLFIYGTLLFLYLKPSLGTLAYPVLAYVLAILFMAISALARFRNVNAHSFLWVGMGALCFVCSDSILAIDMFKKQIPFASLWIMGSYALAQYLIVEGLLKQSTVLKI
ncbi:MAG: lysoplasmalogenase [Maribacter sp.]